MSAKALVENMADVSGCFRPAALDALWAALPDWARQIEIDSSKLPPDVLGAFLSSQDAQSFWLHFSPLPEPLDRELAWCCWRITDLGGRVPVPALQSLLRWLAHAVETQPGFNGSLMARTPRDWERAIVAASAVVHGKLPGPTWRRNTSALLRCCYQMLWTAYDPRPWWQREVWNLALNPRIPRRRHEPAGPNSVYFHQLEPAWLRAGVQWWFKIALETGELTWTTIRARRSGLGFFADWVAGQEHPIPPWIADQPQVRPVMLEFHGYVRGLRARAGAHPGEPLSPLRVNDIVTDVEKFYAFMTDHREEAARALAEPGWLRLGPQHTTLWRRGEKGRPAVRPQRRDVIDDAAFSQVMANLHLLGAPLAEGGGDDEQVMRIMMLVARTGRRVNEICMLDPEPLLAIDRPSPAEPQDDGGFVAKLRYQQTKIAQAPDTILVDAEIVAIIAEQQRWVAEHLAPRWAPETRPKYLFLGHRMNRHTQRRPGTPRRSGPGRGR